MPRIKRKKLTFNEESLNELIQEIYNDTHNVRSDIKTLFNKWGQKVNDPNEIAVLGKSIIDLINTEIKNNDHKVTLAKMLKDVVYRQTKESEVSKSNINSDEKADMLKAVKEELERKKKSPDLN
jgi:membrane-bound lytic murein transglycosylase